MIWLVLTNISITLAQLKTLTEKMVRQHLASHSWILASSINSRCVTFPEILMSNCKQMCTRDISATGNPVNTKVSATNISKLFNNLHDENESSGSILTVQFANSHILHRSGEPYIYKIYTENKPGYFQ